SNQTHNLRYINLSLFFRDNHFHLIWQEARAVVGQIATENFVNGIPKRMLPLSGNIGVGLELVVIANSTSHLDKDVADGIFKIDKGSDIPAIFQLLFSGAQLNPPDILCSVPSVNIPNAEPEQFAKVDSGFSLVIDNNLPPRHFTNGHRLYASSP